PEVAAVTSVVPLGAQKLADNGMMQCMLVKMHGLNLAIPSDFVEAVQNLANVTLQLDADHDWCLGTFGGDSRITLLVDTALKLIPERYDPALAQYNELIILQGRLWALACDELVKSVALPVEKINWSSTDTARPWLWGTYMEERCIVLNVRQLLSQLNDAL
ncbi:chemotaxis protein CheW, partial [Pontibacter sp. JAM-7]|uniref:chemotaxis protein CheW n=1 Tax=Pontibacter sp. JAM-7 TaxID=3366581 RepID=UPI003AF7F31B